MELEKPRMASKGDMMEESRKKKRSNQVHIVSTAVNTSSDLTEGSIRPTVEPETFEKQVLAKGSKAADEKHYEEAIVEFSKLKPPTINSLYLCGCARLEQRRYLETKRAIDEFSECLQLPKTGTELGALSDLWYKRAYAHHSIGSYDNALNDYTHFIESCRATGERGKENLHKGLVGRGLVYQSMSDFNSALEDIGEANKLTEERNPLYLCYRASIFASKNDLRKAEEELKKVSDMNLNDNVQALLQHAVVSSELDRHDIALEDLHKALDLCDTPNQQADIYFRRGVSEYALDRIEDARQSFEHAIRNNSHHARAHFYKGIIHAKLGDLREALGEVTEAHELAPYQSDILLERASINQRLGKLHAAAADHVRMTRLTPSPPLATIDMLENSIQMLRQEIHRSGDATDSATYLKLAKRCHALFNEFREKLLDETNPAKMKEIYSDAIKNYKLSMDKEPKNPVPKAYLALFHARTEDILKAHDLVMELFNLLSENKAATDKWEKLLEELARREESGTLELPLTKCMVQKIKDMDEYRKSFEEDSSAMERGEKDKPQILRKFYDMLRKRLSNLLALLPLTRLTSEVIGKNLKGRSSEMKRLVKSLSKSTTGLAPLTTAVCCTAGLCAASYQKAEDDMAKTRQNTINDFGDVFDYMLKARPIARDICERYSSQLLCLKFSDGSNVDPAAESSKDNGKMQQKIPETVVKIVDFAESYIIETIRNESDRIIPSVIKQNTKNKIDLLADALVLVVSEAHKSKIGTFSRFFRSEHLLPVDSDSVSRIVTVPECENNANDKQITEWDLYEFFRAPGIVYKDHTSNEDHRYCQNPCMKPNLYGYRKGTLEEVNTLKNASNESKS